MSSQTFRFLMMAGGTGGHIFPALAVAEALSSEGHQVSWLGSSGGMEETLVPNKNIPLYTVKVKGFRGKGLLGKVIAPLLLLKSLAESLIILLKLKPQVVIGFGGFAAAPGGLASWLLRKPLVIHEQNSVAGSTNKLLSKFAKKCLVAFPNSLKEGIHIGNPVRTSLLNVRLQREVYDKEISARRFRVLVIGGSLGAKALNDVVPKALSLFPTEVRPDIWHQTGRDKKQAVVEAYKTQGIDARIDEFIDDVEDAYQWADVLICRAGALTVSEVMVTGIPAIFVPLPSAIDNHQYFNAKWLTDKNAAWLIEQKELTDEKLFQQITHCMNDSQNMSDIETNARKVAAVDAVEQVVKISKELANAN